MEKNKSEDIKRYNNIVDDVNIIVESRTTKARTKMMDIFKQLRDIFKRPKTDGDKKDGDETDGDEIDDEQPDTADMSDLESDESAGQRKNQRGQGLKILTPNQMLSRLPISLAQLKVGNNSEKLKNEIRQLLFSFCRSKKLFKTIYKNLINTI